MCRDYPARRLIWPKFTVRQVFKRALLEIPLKVVAPIIMETQD